MADEDGRASLADEAFARNLRAAREHAGLSQAQLAAAMTARGWPYYAQTVHRAEHGDRKISVGEAIALAGILGASVTQLTREGPAAAAAAALRTGLSRARLAAGQVTEWTAELLAAHADLTAQATAAQRDGYHDAAEVHELARLAAAQVLATPEAAVTEGRRLDAKSRQTSERLDHLAETARGGRRLR